MTDGIDPSVSDTERTPYLQDVLADLHTVRGLMNDGRPLEALAHVNDSINRLEDVIDEVR